MRKIHRQILSVFMLVSLLMSGCAGETAANPAEAKERPEAKEPEAAAAPARIEEDLPETEKPAAVIDGINVSEARTIQENLYYYSLSQDYSLYEKNHFEDTIQTVYAEYASLFGFSPLSEGTPLLIVLDPDSPNPNTNLLGDGYRIRLKYRDADETGVFSPRTVYEFGHELTHYFYYVKSGLYSKWNEEIIAEAMALYMLHRLDGKVYGSGYSLPKYLDLYLTDDYVRNDKAMKSQALKSAELSGDAFYKLSENVKQNADAEIRYLYEVFLRYPDSDIMHIMDLYDHFDAETQSIDYGKWGQAYKQSGFIHDVAAIQPKLASGGT